MNWDEETEFLSRQKDPRQHPEPDYPDPDPEWTALQERIEAGAYDDVLDPDAVVGEPDPLSPEELAALDASYHAAPYTHVVP
jgi:hypothetical protein